MGGTQHARQGTLDHRVLEELGAEWQQVVAEMADTLVDILEAFVNAMVVARFQGRVERKNPRARNSRNCSPVNGPGARDLLFARA